MTSTVGSAVPLGILRWTTADGQKKQLAIPAKVLRYLHFIERLQRLFITEESAKMMKWHKDGKRYHPDKISTSIGR